MSQTIENIRTKCEEIRESLEFIYSLAGKAEDANWPTYDPGYVHMIAVYSAAKADLATKVSELPSP